MARIVNGQVVDDVSPKKENEKKRIYTWNDITSRIKEINLLCTTETLHLKEQHQKRVKRNLSYRRYLVI